MDDFDNLKDSFNYINSKEELRNFIDKLQILSYNERSNESVLILVEQTIAKCKKMKDHPSLIKLYSLKISHLQYFKEKTPIVKKLAREIESLSEKYDYSDGKALFYAHMWFIYKFEGSNDLSNKSIKKVAGYIRNEKISDPFIRFICQYTFAFNSWTSNHDFESAKFFEECLSFSYDNNLVRSFVQILGILSIIYTHTQKNKNILEMSKKIFTNNELFEKMNTDVKGVLYYFTGLGYLISKRQPFWSSKLPCCHAI